MRPRPVKSPLTKVLLVVLTALVPASPLAAQYSDKVTNTPTLVQTGFGVAGAGLPFDGLAYCGPTTLSMSLLWLGKNGFTQIGPANPTLADGHNLDLLIGGLAATSPLGGTFGSSIYGQPPSGQAALDVYLSAKGIAPASYSVLYENAPSAAWMQAHNQNQSVVNLCMGWYAPTSTPGVYTRSGGHFVTVLAGEQPGPGNLIINNPEPSSLYNVPDLQAFVGQTHLTTVFTGSSSGNLDPSLTYHQFAPAQLPPWLTSFGGRAVIEIAWSITVNAAAGQPGWTPQPWIFGANIDMNTNGAYLSVLAPSLTGGFGLTKSNAGTLDMIGVTSNSTTGEWTLNGGVIHSYQTGGTPTGTGALALNFGTLALSPTGAGAVSLALASDAGRRMTFGGGATLAVNRGGNSDLALTLGGHTDGTTPNLLRTGNGTLVLAIGSGIADLGGATRILVNGSAGNLPALTNGIVSPSIVGQDNDADRSGDFLTYGANGFARASYVLSSSTPINSASSTSIYWANTPQTVSSGSTAAVYALKVGAVTISSGGGTTILQVGSQAAGAQGGVILNGGTIAASTLEFGAAQGLIYTGQGGGVVSSQISGTGGLVTFGPGALTVTGANTYSGATVIQSGRLIAANSSGSATGVGGVIVQPFAKLQVNSGAAITGAISVTNNATLDLQGGQVGAVSIATSGQIVGTGTIGGHAGIVGQISGGAVVNLTFTSSANLENSIYHWVLGALTDDPAQAGTAYSLLTFTGPGSGVDLGVSGSPVNFDFNFDAVTNPNTPHAFWNTPHTWTAITSVNSPNTLWYSFETPQFVYGSFSMSNSVDYSQVYINFTPVPEPMAIALIGVSGLFFMRQSGKLMRRKRVGASRRAPVSGQSNRRIGRRALRAY